MLGNTILTNLLKDTLVFRKTRSIIILLLKCIFPIIFCILDNISFVVSESIARYIPLIGICKILTIVLSNS